MKSKFAVVLTTAMLVLASLELAVSSSNNAYAAPKGGASKTADPPGLPPPIPPTM